MLGCQTQDLGKGKEFELEWISTLSGSAVRKLLTVCPEITHTWPYKGAGIWALATHKALRGSQTGCEHTKSTPPTWHSHVLCISPIPPTLSEPWHYKFLLRTEFQCKLSFRERVPHICIFSNIIKIVELIFYKQPDSKFYNFMQLDITQSRGRWVSIQQVIQEVYLLKGETHL